MATQGAAREVEMTQEEVDGEIHRIFDGESDESEFEGFDVGSSEDDDSDLQGSDEDDEEQPRVWNWRTVTADNDTADASAWLPGVTRQRGPTAQADENISPADCFATMFTDEAVDIAVTQTNLYAQRKLEALGAHFPSSRMRKWHDISSREMKVFFVLLLAMSIVEQPALADHWTTDWLYQTPGFAKVMSRNRFQLILSCLHFVDNTTIEYDEHGRYRDPLAKIGKFLDIIVKRFRLSYYPKRDVSVDEQMIAYKGRLSFKQYMPAKPTKWGVKAFVLAEPGTGYIYEWTLYTGKDMAEGRDVAMADTSKGSQIVAKLVRHLGQGHVVYMDNYYSSPTLFQWLSSRRGMGAVGTVRVNRKGLPPACKDKKKKGTPPRFWRDETVLTCSWPDKKQVTVLSTIHSCEVVDVDIRDRRAPQGVRSVKKPSCIASYNSLMGGVDEADQMLSYYAFPHRHRRWYLILFHQLLEISVHNAKIIYNAMTGKDLDGKEFHKALIASLFTETQWPIGEPRRRSVPATTDDVDTARLTERHFCTQLAVEGNRDCVVCSRRPDHRKQTSWQCVQCVRMMCPGECFQRFHTLHDYRVRYAD
eukprot:scpid50910/ scgid2388/ PiggyBac transposable element-derived protein 4